ncbi:MAG: alanine--tRNA ligase [Bacillales bacterium]|nr:alanine--tRNA ligase [Bacillales bacterium]
MKKMTSSQIRQMWLDFFKSKGHYVEPSASLIPNNDPTLLWINAGVAALKKYFDGSEISKYSRITNAQKAIRTNDIENVGKTARHHTFFEMLGNFSIGDYFRNEVIPWAYELLMSEKWFDFPKEKIYITHHTDDLATRDLWIKCGIEPSHLIPLDGNFWEIGNGPCGPDTEIFFDRGEKYDPNHIGIDLLKNDIENDRYIEIWNIVFSQYNSEEGVERKNYKELPSKNIDTGAGLERITCVIQEVETNYDTDLFMPYIEYTEKLAKFPYDDEHKMPYRVIADHIRTCTFALADGATFSNEGRGYVLRRILRRAVRFGKKLGIEKPFLSDLVPVVCENMKSFYPYLFDKKEKIMKMILKEEEKFNATLVAGESLCKKMLANVDLVLSGEDCFKLYDTYGFPYELTEEIAEENGKKCDRAGFDAQMKAQKERARAARGDKESFKSQSKDLMEFDTPSEFIYENKWVEGVVTGLFKDGVKVDSINDEGEVCFDKTSFYATMGGQVCDLGSIENDNCFAEVNDVNTAPNKQHLHSIKVEYGEIKVGDKFLLKLDTERRAAIQRNHSVLHLLQSALQKVLGEHVHQEGSYCSDTVARFDFNHYEKVSFKQLCQIEKTVNEFIAKDYPVVTEVLPLEEAKKKGAMMLFNEKYGEFVRVVEMGNVSSEFCGGTHVSHLGDIGLFTICYEESIAAGIRRIEAKTGMAAYELLKQKEIVLNNVMGLVKSGSINEIITRINSFNNELFLLRKMNAELTQELSNYKSKAIESEFKLINGKHVLFKKVSNMDKEMFSKLFDSLKTVHESSIVILANVLEDKIQLIASVSKDLTMQYKARNIIKQITSICGGSGGGRPEVAQGGAKDASKLDDAFASIKEVL